MQRRLLAALFLCAAALAAQDPTPPAAVPTQDPPTSRAAIQQQVDALRDDAALAPELKNQLSEVYGRALDFAKSTEANEAATRTFAEQSATAANRFQEVRAQLDEIGDPFAPTPGATLPTLEQELQAKTQALAAATTEATDREKESRRRAERRANVPAVIADRRKMLEALPEQLPDTPGTDPRLLTARRIARVTERAQLRSEIDG